MAISERQSVKSGKSAFEHAFGTDLFNYISQHPEAAEAFNAGMTGFAESDSDPVLGSYEFTQARMVRVIPTPSDVYLIEGVRAA